ncbi:MAG: aminomethyl-transferring glycine dehydrogenase subunit GcvPA [Firmicutes bacterium]|nr:aminomethyl-transferring glycine dehydrogenase subunit GcvPA [Bacillota bacterium]
MSYIPQGEEERARMLAALGLESVEELYAVLPEEARLGRPLRLPGPLSELELERELGGLAARNADASKAVCFLGAGAYDRWVPAVVDAIVGRGEFLTAYTPYQPEVSQGTLQSIFEYQSMICGLTGLEVANASLYDGASALGEALLMAANVTGRERFLLPSTLHPFYRDVAEAYARGPRLRLETLPEEGGRIAAGAVSQVDETVAAVVVQQPNFLGLIEDPRPLVEAAHAGGALAVLVVDPVSLGLLASPGELGADIAVGEGQPLGSHLNFGGPYLGFLAARERYVRRMPGRIAGQTRDVDGRVGYVLTLQAREQHIRRERATSNVCTNEALVALAASVYLATLGTRGLGEVARQSALKARYLAAELGRLPGVRLAFDGPFFDEFVVELPQEAEAVSEAMLDRGFLAGLPLGRFRPGWERRLLVAVTEKRSREELDGYVRALGEVLAAWASR